MASPSEKDGLTMPTHKIFKRRVRARMTKTGESYTTARRQLLRKATEPEQESAESLAGAEATAGSATAGPSEAFVVADETMVRATGRSHAEWFGILDDWGAAERGHTATARWLHESHGVPNWYTQSITVAYERARGLRALHQMRDGFSVSVSRTVGVGAEQLLEAFTNESLRRRWLPDRTMRRRPSRAAMVARFDWSDPPSRVMVAVSAKGTRRATVSIQHEKLPDAATAERLKSAWREWLGVLRQFAERP